MSDQARMRPYRQSELFADDTSARPLVNGTVSREWRAINTDRFAATTQPQDAAQEFPFKINYADIRRGQERFDIYCSMCHGRTGDGDGMIVQRGFTRPPSYHIDRLRNAPAGHFVNVIANGYGAMYSYADRVAPDDRWRIAAYIRALQLSRTIKLAELPAADQDEFVSPKASSEASTPTRVTGAPTATATTQPAGSSTTGGIAK